MTRNRLGLVALTALAFASSTVVAAARPGHNGPSDGRSGSARSAHFSGGSSNFSVGSRVSNFNGARVSGSPQFSGTRSSARIGNYAGSGQNYSYHRRGRGWGGYGVGLGVATGLALGAGYGYGYGYDDPYYASYGYDDGYASDGYYADGYAAYGAGECWVQRRAVVDQFGYQRIRRVRVCQ
jgi:hypothetical protein